MKKTFGSRLLAYLAALIIAPALAYNLFKAFIMTEAQRHDVISLVCLSAFILLILHVCFYNKWTSIISAVLTALALTAALLWAFSARSVSVHTVIPYLPVLLTAGCCIAVFFTAKSRVGLLLLFLFGGGGLFVMDIMGYQLSCAAYFLFLLPIIVLFIRQSYLAGMPKERHSRKGVALITAVAAVTAGAAFVISQSVYGAGLRVNANAAELPRLLDLQAKNSNYVVAGYQTGSQLGRALKPDNTVVLEVKADSPFYLAGMSYNRYLGGRWSNYNTMTAQPTDSAGIALNADGLKILGDNDWFNHFWMFGYAYAADRAAFYRISPTDPTAYIDYYTNHQTDISIKSLRVTYKTNSLGSFFFPVYTLSSESLSQPQQGGIWHKIPSDTSYTLTYRSLTVDSPQIRQILSRDDLNCNEISNYFGSFSGRHVVDKTPLEQLYYTSINRYVQQSYLPTELMPQRVHKLALKITKNCATDYDKVSAIKSYLAKNYKYTLSPKQPPAGQDFADYFLFTGKEGYCQHFATAMTLLLREAGVPCSYVEGYVSPPGSKGGVYEVTNNNAHAWVEVYSKTLGFYTVEATPGFSYAESPAAMPASTSPEQKHTSSASESSTSVSNQSDPGGATVSAGKSTHAKQAQLDLRRLLPVIPAMILCLILLLFAIKFVLRAAWRARLRRLPAKERVFGLYGYYRKVLSKLGLSKGETDTPYEYASKITDQISFGSHDFNGITDIFVCARYGGAAPSGDELASLMSFDRFFERNCRKHAGLLKYLSEYLMI